MKFKSLKNHFVYSIYGAAEMIRENKNAKTENQASAEFKYLENNQLYSN